MNYGHFYEGYERVYKEELPFPPHIVPFKIEKACLYLFCKQGAGRHGKNAVCIRIGLWMQKVTFFHSDNVKI